MSKHQRYFLWFVAITFIISMAGLSLGFYINSTVTQQQQFTQCKQDVLSLFDEVAKVKNPNDPIEVGDATAFKEYRPVLEADLSKYDGERGLKYCQLTYWANTYQYE